MQRYAKICEDKMRRYAKRCGCGQRYANVCEDVHVRIGGAMQTFAKLCEDMQDMRNMTRRYAKRRRDEVMRTYDAKICCEDMMRTYAVKMQ